jgi:hypothetical protein
MGDLTFTKPTECRVIVDAYYVHCVIILSALNDGSFNSLTFEPI